MTFHVGQKVVCIDNCASLGRGRRGKMGWPDAIQVGSVYTIRDVDQRYVDWYGVAGLRFEEYHHPSAPLTLFGPMEPAFPADRFRPVVEKKTDISVFTEMLKPKERVLAP